ncbi:MAG: cytochrome oxidase assembly protein [Flaviaesturariibacter sp.]|nr:cytochrome oxidase assembly protein [Flaviaesturariibacter sp.]
MKGSRHSNAVAIWLFIGVAMLLVQIILGGITRLTGSGLSITEWEVITGAVPPLNDQQWMTEFGKYQQSPQYRLLNSDFTLSDFKFIFFWEWFHRFWGRLIGVVFAIPFIVFLVQRRFKREMVKPLLILFLLGALQGAVGWIMVASGLTGDAIYVKPTRLALHFLFAMVLLGYTFWFALKLSIRNSAILYAPRLKNFTWTLIAVLGIQFIFGALMAGHKAAPAAPTWPTINGSFVPDHLFSKGLVSLIEDRIIIHFIHRSLAYLLVVLILAWSVQAFRKNGGPVFSKWKLLPVGFVLLQTTLGILTVLTSVNIRVTKWNSFEWMAQLHQFVALLLLLSLVGAAFLLKRRSLGRS